MGAVTLVTGPVRSGKSRWAVDRAVEFGGDVVFLATYLQDPSDFDMSRRLELHRAERPASWRTLEAPKDPVAALQSLVPQPSIVIMDCLTLWLGERMNLSDQAIMESWEWHMSAFIKASWPVILVSSEVGWSPVSIDPILRRFCDLSGWINQRTAKDATDVWLCVSGCTLKLK